MKDTTRRKEFTTNLIGFICAVIGVAMSTIVVAQQVPTRVSGAARIIHYTKRDYNGDAQFWTGCQDHTGVLYFGNNDGVIIFDGQRWTRVRLPNGSSARSLLVSSNGIVYAGGFNELGIIKKNEAGKYHYESLLHLLREEDRNIENVWQIHEVQDHIVFRSFRTLIAIKDNKAVTLPSSHNLVFSLVYKDKLFVSDQEGLKSLDLYSLKMELLFKPGQFNNEELLALTPSVVDNRALLITKKGGFFSVDLSKKEITLRQRIPLPQANDLFTSAIRSSNDVFYLGTLRSKVHTVRETLQGISISKTYSNVQDNTVLSLFEGNEGNIWVTLNNGIDCIDVMSPFSLLLEDASMYDVKVYHNRLYVATNQGVFASGPMQGKATLGKNDFANINGLEGQAWSLQVIEDHLLVSHDRGLFAAKDNAVKRIAGVEGVWKVIEVNGKPHQYLVCTYNGMYLLEYKQQTGFTVLHRLEGFNESSRDILQSDTPGVFWICHGYKGVFKIRIDDALRRVVSLEHFKDQNGLPSPFNNNVARWNNEIIFTTNEGIFTYQEDQNKFVLHKQLTAIFGKEFNVRKIFQHGDKTWFAHDDEVGYFFTNETEPKLNKGLFLQLKGSFNPSMECIVPLTPANILIGTTTGLYAFDLSYNASAREARTVLSAVTSKQSDQESLRDLPIAGASRKLPHQTSGIIFHFAAPSFQHKVNTQFSYWLQGVDNTWSDWTEAAQKEYNLLPPGSYTFHVKSRSLIGEKGAEASYNFTILPAWYRSRIAYGVYTILSIAVILGITYLVKRRIRKERQKTQAEEKEKRRVLELEIERMKLAHEKAQILKDKEQLEEDVIYKSKELVNYTALLVKKRELLTEMHDEIKELKENLKNDASRQKLRDLIKKINFNLQDEEHLRVFETNFERVHHEFFMKLKNAFPDLSQKELQLCAFVRMNLTNKEIASILNISVRGVETARYRLRKRLGMPQEEDMGHFLEKLHASNAEGIDEPLAGTDTIG